MKQPLSIIGLILLAVLFIFFTLLAYRATQPAIIDISRTDTVSSNENVSPVIMGTNE